MEGPKASADGNKRPAVTVATEPHPVHSSVGKKPPRKKTEATAVVVAIRIRPLDEWVKKYCRAQPSHDGQPQVEVIPPPDSRDARNNKMGSKLFAFDHVFDPGTQGEIYDVLGGQCLDHAHNGFNASIFAYGMTGSGKTHTMMGTKADPGVILRVCDGLFEGDFVGWGVEVSFLEIYNEQVIDLLGTSHAAVHRGEEVRLKTEGGKMAPPSAGHKFDNSAKPKNKHAMKGLTVREHPKYGVFVEGLTRTAVSSAADIEELLDQGTKMRAVASTNMNSTSSRSHAVVQLFVAEGNTGDKVAQINLVDLAGSENAKRADTSGSRLKEGQNINKSLFCLGQCITILAGADGISDFAARHNDGHLAPGEAEEPDGKSPRMASAAKYVPYRDSTLTWILKESLGGNSKTCMLCTLSAEEANYEQTLATLKYADHAKRIKTKPIVNEDKTKKVIRELESEIKTLSKEMSRATHEMGTGTPSGPVLSTFSTQTYMDKMTEAQELLNMMNVISMSREEKLELAEKLNAQRKKMLEELGIAVDEAAVATDRRSSRRSVTAMPSAPPRRPAPYLTNLSADPQQTGKLIFYLKSGFTNVGREHPESGHLAPDHDMPSPRGSRASKQAGPQTHYIVLNSTAIRPKHARVHNANGICSIAAEKGAAVFINGRLLSSVWRTDNVFTSTAMGGMDAQAEAEAGHAPHGYVLMHGDRVILGSHHVFVYQQPASGEGSPDAAITTTWDEAIAELESKRSFDVGVLMFQAYLSDELGSLLEGEIEFFTDANALNDLTEADKELLGPEAARPARFLTGILRTILVVLVAANLWFEFFSLLSLQVMSPFALVISFEMILLDLLLIGGLISVKVVLWAVPALMRNSTLIFLETLAGAYEAERSSRANQPVGQLFGIILFGAGVFHGFWCSAAVREFVCDVTGALLCLPESDKRREQAAAKAVHDAARRAGRGYARFEDEPSTEASDESPSPPEPPTRPARSARGGDSLRHDLDVTPQASSRSKPRAGERSPTGGDGHTSSRPASSRPKAGTATGGDGHTSSRPASAKPKAGTPSYMKPRNRDMKPKQDFEMVL